MDTIFPKIEIPDGEAHGVKIVNFEITEEEVKWARMRACFRRDSYETPPEPGKHVKLIVEGETMMSDTQMEKDSNRWFVHKAKGDVLVAGLGIGLIIKAIVDKPEVTSITVVEKHEGVIILVAPHAAHPKLTVVAGDIFEWKTKQQFDTIYFDIWPNITTDNLDEMTKLNRKFAKNLRPGGWRGAWMEDRLRSERRSQRSRRW